MLSYLLETFAENGKNNSNLNPVTFITHHRVNIHIIIKAKIFIYQIPIPAQRGLVTFSRSLATRFSWLLSALPNTSGSSGVFSQVIGYQWLRLNVYVWYEYFQKPIVTS